MSKPDPHDRLFKQVFGQPRHASAYFRTFLPKRLQALLDLDAPELVPGSFVDEELASRECDLLFTVPRREGGEGFVYLLFEHQSAPDAMIALRLLRYMVRIWDRWLGEHAGATRVPLIVPMVLYHGERPFPAVGLRDLVDLGRHAAVSELVPSFEYLLVDLHRRADDQLGPAPEAVTLRFMKYVRARDLLAELRALTPDSPWAVDLRTLSAMAESLPLLSTLVIYVLDVRPNLDVEAVAQTLRRVASPSTGDLIVSTAAQLRQEGRLQGRQEGRDEALREVLIRQLERRFGALPAETRARVDAAASEDLERWLDRFALADSLGAVFA